MSFYVRERADFVHSYLFGSRTLSLAIFICINCFESHLYAFLFSSRISINLKVIANFSDQLFATHVVIKIPVPKNTAKAKIKHSFGRAKYEPEQQAIVWRVKRFPGKAECHIQADVDLMPTVRPKPWSRPPINAEFQVPMFTSSGVHVRFLRVYDKSGYHTNRWVRYITKAGSYQIRI